MNDLFPMILGIIDQLNEWNEKLNSFASEHMDNVIVGTVIFFGILLVMFWGIGSLNKKQ